MDERNLIVTTRMSARPEPWDDLFGALRGMIEPTRVEPGCVSCDLYRSAEEEHSLCLMERWATAESLQQHLRTRNYKHLLALMDLLDTPPDMQIHFTLETVEGLEYAASVLEER